ncbi:MAG: N-acetyltransferase [Rhodoferax sp.]|nr:N-acetyltransferase [Rhodoferax sp.]
MRIVEATPADTPTALTVEREAFGRDDEAALVAALLHDTTARPCLSLLAYDGEQAVGHALFTRVSLIGAGPDNRGTYDAADARELRCAILAPLAVVPAAQRRVVGRALIEAGAARLAAAGVQLLFVLGDPAYYTRCGFGPALPHGLHAPYPIEPAAAWRVRALAPGVLDAVQGSVACAESMAAPEYWRE